MIIDAKENKEDEVAECLSKELKVFGYHRVDTRHVFHKVSYTKKTLHVIINRERESFPFETKIIGDLSRPLSLEIEHDFLVRVQKVLDEKLHSPVSLMELRGMIESRLKESGDEITLEI